MVKVTYRRKNEDLLGECALDASLLFANGRGSYYLATPTFCDLAHQWSFYQGLHFAYATNDGWSMCKTLHGIFPVQGDVKNIVREQKTATVNYNSGLKIQYLLMPENVLCASVETRTDIETLRLVFDARSIYDFSTTGRFYSVEQVGDVTLYKYTKRVADSADSSVAKLPDSSTDYVFYIAVLTTNGAKVNSLSNWFSTSFELEKSRGGGLTSLYMYHAADITCESNCQIFVASGLNHEEVITNVSRSSENYTPLLRTMRQYCGVLTRSVVSSVKFPLASLAHECAIIGLDSLYVKPIDVDGIYAGLPWFYQFWTRDEAIALGGLLAQKRYRDVKQLLNRQMAGVLSDGRLSNRYPKSMLGSADGIGWCAKRWYDLIKQCANERVLGEFMSDKELGSLRDLFVDSYENLKKNYSNANEHSGLFRNAAIETWMDTHAANDVRDGYRIEIQALTLIQLRLINTLISLVGVGKKKSYNEEEMLFVQTVTNEFFDGNRLIDGITLSGKVEDIQRPNIFLAHYIYPGLLSSKQWEIAFDFALSKLWLGWGGLSTIDISHPLFCPSYTGENNLSYHRGDSWYFVNNIAAMSLWRLNAQKYRTSVEAIIASSTHDLLWQGSLGFSSEVSNARNQSASACTAQAWSMGTLIELLQSVFETK